ncbi:MAG: hypothetical protein IJW64_00135 [Clostridia bacterium]|nr:hypothetical protein [Clostridia bacterium]
MRFFKKAVALFITVILIISSTSCFSGLFRPVEGIKGMPAYTLTEDDVKNAETLLKEAETITVENGSTYQMNVAWAEFIDAYYHVSTQANVAFIKYCLDVTHQTNKQNYLFASQSASNLYGKYSDSLKAVYNSSARDTFFQGWSQSEINSILNHDENVVKLENENSALEVEHSALSDKDFYDGTTTIYKKIVKNNNEIAKKFGYNDYYEYAYAEVYGRVTSTVSETLTVYQEFKNDVYGKIIGWIDEMKTRFETVYNEMSQSEKLTLKNLLESPYNQNAVNYWDGYLNYLDDNNLSKQLNHAFEYENVVFAENSNARDVAFTVYMPEYSKSMCYFGLNYQDIFTISHEIGHYYANLNGAINSNSMDLNETHSQSNEMLMLAYLQSTTQEKMFKAVESYVLSNFFTNVLIGVLIDEFEYNVYKQSSVDNFTSADFDAIMTTVCNKFGGKDKVEKYLSNVNKYWRMVVVSQPVYYISYATSAIGAIGLYVKADEDFKSAKDSYVYLIEETDASQGFEKALKSAGYLNPFSDEAFSEINKFITGVGAVGGENQNGGADNLSLVA